MMCLDGVSTTAQGRKLMNEVCGVRFYRDWDPGAILAVSLKNPTPSRCKVGGSSAEPGFCLGSFRALPPGGIRQAPQVFLQFAPKPLKDFAEVFLVNRASAPSIRLPNAGQSASCLPAPTGKRRFPISPSYFKGERS